MFNGFLKGDATNEDNGSLQNQFVAPISTPDPRAKKHAVSRFLLWSLILTVFVAVGAYLFTGYLNNQVEAEKQSLTNTDKSTNVTDFGKNLSSMETLSKKLQLINTIYDSKQYIASMFFPVLESQVESSQNSYVYFKSFNLKKDYTDNLSKISLSGVALDYPTLYRQVNDFKFGKYSKLITDFQLGKFSKDDNGNVEFDISFSIDVSTLSFLNFLKDNLGLGTTTIQGTVQSGPLYTDLDNSNGDNGQSLDNSTTSDTETVSGTGEASTSATETDNQSGDTSSSTDPNGEDFNTNGQVD